MKVRDELYEAAAMLNGDNYRKLLSELEVLSAEINRAILTTPPHPVEGLIQAQGRAQMLAELVRVLKEAPDKAYSLRAQRKSR